MTQALQPPLSRKVLKTLSSVKLKSILFANNWPIPVNTEQASLIDAIVALQKSKEEKKPKLRILWSDHDRELFTTLLSKEQEGSLKQRCKKILGTFNAKADIRRNVKKLVSKYHSMQRAKNELNNKEEPLNSEEESFINEFNALALEDDSDYDVGNDEESDDEVDLAAFMNDKQSLIEETSNESAKKKKNTKEVLEYIEWMGYPEYVSILKKPFRENEIFDVESMKCLDVQDLQEFGITKLLDCKDIISKIQEL